MVERSGARKLKPLLLTVTPYLFYKCIVIIKIALCFLTHRSLLCTCMHAYIHMHINSYCVCMYVLPFYVYLYIYQERSYWSVDPTAIDVWDSDTGTIYAQ